MEVSSKVVIVTGGSKGLGMGFVECLLAEGQRVHTYSRTQTEFIEKMRAQYPNKFRLRSTVCMNALAFCQ